MATKQELQEQLNAKNKEMEMMKDQMKSLMESMDKQQQAMGQLQSQLQVQAPVTSGTGAATVVNTKVGDLEKEERREEAKTVETLKLAVPILQWGGKNFELWEEKVRLVLMYQEMEGRWGGLGRCGYGGGDHGGQDGRQLNRSRLLLVLRSSYPRG